MRKSNFYQTKRIFVLLLLTFGIITSAIGNNFLTLSLNKNARNQKENFETIIEEENLDELSPKLAEPQEFNGNGEQMVVTLHQSLVNTSLTELTNIDVSNSFKECS